MVIQLGMYEVPLEIIRKKNKNIYFRFNDEGILVVTCNRFVSEKELRNLIVQNEKSLLRMYEKYMKELEKSKQFYYLGKPYTLVYDENVKEVEIKEDFIYARDSKKLEQWQKKECMKIFEERVNVLLQRFSNLPLFTLKIRKMKTRWGVNNVTKRIITLNSELLRKDVDLIDYVIIHELCHFYEANHSSKFWYQVSLRYPDYKMARKRLRD